MHRTILQALVICVVFSFLAYAAGLAFADGEADRAAFEKEYKSRLAKIDDKKLGADAAADKHLELAVWAQEQEQLDVAQAELKHSLKLKPNNERAQLMLRRVEAAIKAAETETNEPATKPVQTATGGPASGDGKDFVSDVDIQKIKWAELKRSDKNISVDFKTVKYKFNDKDKTARADQQFVDSQLGQPDFDRNAFAKLSMAERLIEIRETPGYGGVDIFNDIVIKSDPIFMRNFRTVWPNINSSCASVNCHGAPKGKGEFKLFPRGAGTNDRADYTNYLILNLWEKGGEQMINRDRPEDSLVLQYGLPRNDAKFKHPVVQGMKPPFPNTKGNYAKFEQFIKELDGVRTPNYGTEYQPPAGKKLSSGGMSTFLGPADDEE